MTGDLATGQGIEAAVDGAAIIVHCAGSSKGDDDKARNLVRPAARAGTRHLVNISVVGADRVPVVSAAAVADLPVDRFAAGGAINQTARQVGAVLGIAILVAIVGSPGSAAEALDHFRSAWLMCAGAALASAALSAFQAPLVASSVSPTPAEVPVFS